jgi:hypothetical protein
MHNFSSLHGSGVSKVLVVDEKEEKDLGLETAFII